MTNDRLNQAQVFQRPMDSKDYRSNNTRRSTLQREQDDFKKVLNSKKREQSPAQKSTINSKKASKKESTKAAKTRKNGINEEIDNSEIHNAAEEELNEEKINELKASIEELIQILQLSNTVDVEKLEGLIENLEKSNLNLDELQNIISNLELISKEIVDNKLGGEIEDKLTHIAALLNENSQIPLESGVNKKIPNKLSTESIDGDEGINYENLDFKRVMGKESKNEEKELVQDLKNRTNSSLEGNTESGNSKDKAALEGNNELQGLKDKASLEGNKETRSSKDKASLESSNNPENSKGEASLKDNIHSILKKDTKNDLTNLKDADLLNIKDFEIKEFKGYELSQANRTLGTAQKPANVFNQIIQGARVSITEDVSEMVLKLKPDNLGKLSMKIVLERGMLVAKFEVESQMVKEAIESNLEDLRNALSDKGFEIQEMDVSVNKDSQGEGNQFSYFGKESGKKIKINSNFEKNDIYVSSFHNAVDLNSTINYLG